MNRLLGIALIAAVGLAFGARADAASIRHVHCGDGSVRSSAYRLSSRVAQCVVKPHHLVATSMYYQNASKVGGTAVAGYPQLRVRYGLAARVELFYDAPTELAVSAKHGGQYVMAHPGLGAQTELARSGVVVFSLSAQSHPQLSPLANLYLIPLADVHLAATWSGAHDDFAAEVGTLNYIASNYGRRRSSLFDAFSASRALGSGTWVTSELGIQSNASYGSAGETRGIVGLTRELSEGTLFGVDLGTAFNASSNSKPHYLGAGFTFLR